MKKIIITSVLILLYGSLLRAQDNHLSLNDRFNVYLTPSNISQNESNFSAGALYRTQWRTVGVAFDSYMLNGSGTVYKNDKVKLTAGGLVANHTALAISKIQASFLASSAVRISKYQFLSAGLGIGLAGHTISPSKLQWSSQYDGQAFDAGMPSMENIYSEKKYAADISAGVTYRYCTGNTYKNEGKELLGGVGVWHVNQPEIFYISDGQHLERRYNIFLMGYIPAGKKIGFKPKVFYTSQSGFDELLIGNDFRLLLRDLNGENEKQEFTAASLILAYRHHDAIIGGIGVEREKYTLSLLYDYNYSDLKKATSGFGAFEIFFSYQLPSPSVH